MQSSEKKDSKDQGLTHWEWDPLFHLSSNLLEDTENLNLSRYTSKMIRHSNEISREKGNLYDAFEKVKDSLNTLQRQLSKTLLKNNPRKQESKLQTITTELDYPKHLKTIKEDIKKFKEIINTSPTREVDQEIVQSFERIGRHLNTLGEILHVKPEELQDLRELFNIKPSKLDLKTEPVKPVSETKKEAKSQFEAGFFKEKTVDNKAHNKIAEQAAEVIKIILLRNGEQIQIAKLKEYGKWSDEFLNKLKGSESLEQAQRIFSDELKEGGEKYLSKEIVADLKELAEPILNPTKRQDFRPGS